jgi:hypothetical protein
VRNSAAVWLTENIPSKTEMFIVYVYMQLALTNCNLLSTDIRLWKKYFAQGSSGRKEQQANVGQVSP